MFIDGWYNWIEKHDRGVFKMKKLSNRQKKWQIAHAKKELRRRTKKNRLASRRCQAKNVYKKGKDDNICPLVAPKKLSLFEGQEDTLAFFKDAFNTICECRENRELWFDLSAVEVVTPDAIMYLIALIKNTRRLKEKHLKCSGNLPGNIEAKKAFEEAGFFDYVNRLDNTNSISGDNGLRISHGHESDGALAGSICDFVHRSTETSRHETKRLFSMIIELMTNTKQHAYPDKHSMMNEHWYIFAENRENGVHFVFLDTGDGIPDTVRKSFTEIIRGWMVKSDDAKMIASALRGEFRTETKQDYRGKGLPQIYNDSCDGLIKNLNIISGNGKCVVDEDGRITEEVLNTEFMGTLFCWDFVINQEV